MRSSSVTWIFQAFVPWCLALGLVVSFTAEAGQDMPIGSSSMAATGRSPTMPDDLIPQTRQYLAAFLLGQSQADRAPWSPARTAGGLAAGNDDSPKDEAAPRLEFKRYVRLGPGGKPQVLTPLPDVDRGHKSDPLIALRPAFEARLRHDSGFRGLRADGMLFGHDESAIASAFELVGGDAPGPETTSRFEPWPEGESPTTVAAHADISPAATGASLTGDTQVQVRDGASPAVPRAVALGSATPVALDATPVEVAAFTAVTVDPAKPAANATLIARTSQPDFAALLDPGHVVREKRCLAEAIYFEARSESAAGQAAVAQVVLNRVSSGLYPSSVCGVVYQNRQRHNACQFSFACDGKSLRINEPEPWAEAVRIADAVTSGQTYNADVGGSTHYHANYVRPRWARKLKKMDVIGHHIFYKLRPGQT